MGPGPGQVISARGAPGEGAWSAINIAAQIDLGADNQRGCASSLLGTGTTVMTS